jgi:hypothetical protein
MIFIIVSSINAHFSFPIISPPLISPPLYLSLRWRRSLRDLDGTILRQSLHLPPHSSIDWLDRATGAPLDFDPVLTRESKVEREREIGGEIDRERDRERERMTVGFFIVGYVGS